MVKNSGDMAIYTYRLCSEKTGEEVPFNLSLLNWCLNNTQAGGRIITDWDVLKNAVEGNYINEIPFESDKKVWMRRGMESIQMSINELVKGE